MVVQVYVDPPPIPLIKGKHDDKLDKDLVELKFCRDKISENADIYECKKALFENKNPEEFFLFVRNFNMTIDASGSMDMAENIQYLCTLVRGEALCQFDTLSADAESTNPLTVEAINLVLDAYFPPVISLPKKKRAMRRGMRKLRGLKVRCTRIV